MQVDFKLPAGNAAIKAEETCPADAFPVDLTDKQCYGLTQSCLLCILDCTNHFLLEASDDCM